MPNQFKFEVFFHKADILQLLDENATDLKVTGGLTYDASTGSSVMEISAEKIGPGSIESVRTPGCPMPCSIMQPKPGIEP